MKYFKNAEGAVYAFEADGSQDEFIPAGLVLMSAEEVAAHLRVNTPTQEDLRRAEIMAELAAIDAASARPLRAILVGSSTDDDRERLAELDQQAAVLRAELSALGSAE